MADVNQNPEDEDQPHEEAKTHPDSIQFGNIGEANPTPAQAPSAEEAFESVYGYKPSESPEEAAKEMLKEALVPAVQSLVHIATYSENDRTRADASKYIIERNLGKLSDRLPLGDMWDELLKELNGPASETGKA